MRQKCARRRRIVLKLLLLTLVPGTIVVFVFGNPQWNRWIYIVQVYRLQKRKFSFWLPEDFTGTWRNWKEDGTLLDEMGYVDGKAKKTIWRYPDGHVWMEEIYLGQAGHYLRRVWFKEFPHFRYVKRACVYRDWKPFRGINVYAGADIGDGYIVEQVQDGKVVESTSYHLDFQRKRHVVSNDVRSAPFGRWMEQSWYLNMQLAEQCSMEGGVALGVNMEWYRNGKKKKCIDYNSCEAIEWDRDGNEIKHTDFSMSFDLETIEWIGLNIDVYVHDEKAEVRKVIPEITGIDATNGE